MTTSFTCSAWLAPEGSAAICIVPVCKPILSVRRSVAPVLVSIGTRNTRASLPLTAPADMLVSPVGAAGNQVLPLWNSYPWIASAKFQASVVVGVPASVLAQVEGREQPM